MPINIIEEHEKVEFLKQNIVTSLVNEAKEIDGTYNSAVNYLSRRREEFLFKNNQPVLKYFNCALAALDQELEERVDFLKDKEIYK